MIDNVLKSILTFFNGIFKRKYKVIPQKINLKFNQNGEFKIVQFTDLHEYSLKNKKTIRLIENVLDTEHPDLVVLTGDIIDGRFCKLKEEVKKAIANIAKPMEDRKIPWAVVLGNHDDELCMVNRKNQMKMYMSYKYNLSQSFSSVIGRAGDYNLIINNSKNDKPIFNIYMLDSGSYDIKGYGYIRKEQIDWYKKLSTDLKKQFGKIIPSLMFFHIPLQQQYKVWQSGKAIGERNEKESPQAVDSGLFSALIEMGDVKGVLVGHDHTNDYIGDLNGITLGYGRKTGYNSYGKKGFAKGARIIILNENNLEKLKTYKKLEMQNNK
ncbi:metallophosphoesterase family protein [Clostridium autoethanogenum]|uniref:metallophosphoesterase family protein n=1 Tax=Clostridium autoethanogenum TaxID=84023 RepID=UPI0003FC4D52|nr:metallophosphoesterase family protein [Clostridium autoethanogenum]ALU35909.1 Metallophosphoesterase [Clostridium autoethanogenum DSM 10061]OVY52032.1 Calcineurin-like phosphoesterase [Clostridium autoethanogenum]